MSFAFVFPGQGSQSVGMLQALAAADGSVRTTCDEASQVLGYDVWRLVSEGPEETLNATEQTQPAMLAAGVATWRVWRARGGALPALVAGHSLGEFTALVCAEALPFPAALDLVRFRGQAMQAAVPAGTGAMAAILGLEDEAVESACHEAARGAVVEAANFNSPGQVVIAGEKAAVERAIEAARTRGAKRAVRLPVSVPSQSSLMSGAAARLREKLAAIDLRAPHIGYVSGGCPPPRAHRGDPGAPLAAALEPCALDGHAARSRGKRPRADHRMRPGKGAHRPQPPHRAAPELELSGARRSRLDRSGAERNPGGFPCLRKKSHSSRAPRAA